MLHTMLLTTPVSDPQCFRAIAEQLELPTIAGKHTCTYYSRIGFREISLVHHHGETGRTYRGLEIRLNPQVLLNPHNIIQSTLCTEISRIAESFDNEIHIIFGRTASLLPGFDHWTCKRIDYCVDISSEHVDEYIRLFQRSAVPNRYFEAKNKLSGSAYAKSGSVTINFYNKQDELAKRMQHQDTRITKEHLDTAQNLLRLEIQCLRDKTNYIKQREGFESKKVQHFLNPLLAEKLLVGYYDKSIGCGDFYSLYEARKRIKETDLQDRTKQTMYDILNLVAQARNVETARKQYEQGISIEGRFIQGSRTSFQRGLQRLRSIGINPVTIPRSWRIHHLPSLREQLVRGFCCETD
ncbi:phage/plasmid replication domain-containing protein [Gorillibacterium timonense]|uniref:phage/plasmid replication domain-containing protein n=1 Tax=Gorillibacterium timonense TaxID=1689269 RepID=UPI00071E4430|nr:phage/plasmid replication protein [Gorillibacterium timonense]